MRGYLGLTEYTPEDALRLMGTLPETPDDETVEQIERLRRTFDDNYRGEENS